MIAILDTGIANLSSVAFACERLGRAYVITSDAEQLNKASHVIFPGVGTAKAFMKGVKENEILECLKTLTQPVLGICLGMQVLYEWSEEGEQNTLGILPGQVRRLEADALPVPHMGWNRVLFNVDSLLLKGIEPNSFFYFVHSFVVPDSRKISAWTEYGERIPSVVESGSWFGTQFHPERSGEIGQNLLSNFLQL